MKTLKKGSNVILEVYYGFEVDFLPVSDGEKERRCFCSSIWKIG